MTMPQATPEPIVTRAKSLQPAAAPNQCSAAVSARTSFSTTVGNPVRLPTMFTNGTSTQSRNGDTRTTSDRGDTGPARLIPTARMPESAAASASTARAMRSVTEPGSVPSSGIVRSVRMRARMSVVTRLSWVAESLMPTRWARSTLMSIGCAGRPVRWVDAVSDSVIRPTSLSDRAILVRVAGDIPARLARSARDSGPWTSRSMTTDRAVSDRAGNGVASFCMSETISWRRRASALTCVPPDLITRA